MSWVDAMEDGRQRVLVLAAGVSIVTGLGLVGALELGLARLRRRPVSVGVRRGALVFGALVIAELGCVAWGLLVEPRWLDVTHLEVETRRLPAGTRLRLVHFTDTHLHGQSPLIESLPERIAQLAPDLVVFTGDAASSSEGLHRFNALLRRIPARLGRFAVKGNNEAWGEPGEGIFGDAAAELVGSPVVLPGVPVTLCGAPNGFGKDGLRCLEQAPE
ncbi:MAG: metallophosphoesterase, partial [Deltaproteobacteria bacterium]|nr:metallophosphoesterase [Deltaproteobacteria bacterium]